MKFRLSMDITVFSLISMTSLLSCVPSFTILKSDMAYIFATQCTSSKNDINFDYNVFFHMVSIEKILLIRICMSYDCSIIAVQRIQTFPVEK